MNMGVRVGAGNSGPDTLAGVLAAANNSVEGRGLLSPAKCNQYRQNSDGQVVCTSPVPDVAEIYYQNYSSLTALYDAYESLVSEFDGGTFRQNTGTCGDSAVSYAEFGWNQEEGHPHNFTVGPGRPDIRLGPDGLFRDPHETGRVAGHRVDHRWRPRAGRRDRERVSEGGVPALGIPAPRRPLPRD
jgi:hypothetical protein